MKKIRALEADTPPLWIEAEWVGVVHPGEDKAPGTLYHTFATLRGDLEEGQRKTLSWSEVTRQGTILLNWGKVHLGWTQGRNFAMVGSETLEQVAKRICRFPIIGNVQWGWNDFEQGKVSWPMTGGVKLHDLPKFLPNQTPLWFYEF